MEAENSAYRFPLGRLDKMVMGDAHRVEGPHKFALPVRQKRFETGEQGGQVIFLPDKELQKRRVIGNAIVDFGCRQTKSFHANQEVFTNQNRTFSKVTFLLQR
jgi:hypothetical protein